MENKKSKNTKHNNNADRLVRLKDLPEFINVSTRTIENWIEDGLISVIRVGAVNLFDPDQVIADLKRFEQPALNSDEKNDEDR